MSLNKRNIMRKIAMEIKKNQLDISKLKTLLLQIDLYHIDPNTRIYKGRTLLHYAVLGNNTDIVLSLCKNGVNVNLCDDTYNTPLHFAIGLNSYHMVETLLQVEGIDLNALGEFDQTPLHRAVIMGNLKIIKLLIENGADPYMVDEKNESPLDYAKDEDNQMIIKYLDEKIIKEGESIC